MKKGDRLWRYSLHPNGEFLEDVIEITKVKGYVCDYTVSGIEPNQKRTIPIRKLDGNAVIWAGGVTVVYLEKQDPTLAKKIMSEEYLASWFVKMEAVKKVEKRLEYLGTDIPKWEDYEE